MEFQYWTLTTPSGQVPTNAMSRYELEDIILANYIREHNTPLITDILEAKSLLNRLNYANRAANILIDTYQPTETWTDAMLNAAIDNINEQQQHSNSMKPEVFKEVKRIIREKPLSSKEKHLQLLSQPIT